MNARLATARHHLAALVAVVALLGQAFFPHVHAWHGPQGRDVHAALAHCDGACPTVVAAAPDPSDADADHDQHGTSCPLCRAQNDARSSLMPPSLAVPLPAAVATGFTVDTVAAIASAVRSLAAPRAPPVLA